MQVDWSKRVDYVGERHGIPADWADEAANDRHAVWQVPDPASRSGLSVRVIGYSPSARAVRSRKRWRRRAYTSTHTLSAMS